MSRSKGGKRKDVKPKPKPKGKPRKGTYATDVAAEDVEGGGGQTGGGGGSYP